MPYAWRTDPNIPETGDQLVKSNNGPENCCYRYCSSSVYDGLCSYCDLPTNQSSLTAAELRADAREDVVVAAEHCPLISGGSTTTTTSSSAAEPRCQTPYQASTLAAKSSATSFHSDSMRRWHAAGPATLSSTNNNRIGSLLRQFTWTISWSLFNIAVWQTVRTLCRQLSGIASSGS